MKIVSRLGQCTCVLLLVLVAPLALAAGKEGKERAARKACLSGDYAKGVGLLSDLYIDTGNPNYIFNQARCFEQNSRCEEAVGRFREYLRKATALSPADRADTEQHIADCQALLDRKDSRALSTAQASPGAESSTPMPIGPPAEPARAPAVSSPPPAPSAPVASVAPSPVPESLTLQSAPAPAPHPGRSLRLAGIACGVVGLASVGTAIYFYTRAKDYSDKVSKEPVPVPSDEQAGKNAQTMQWVFYGVGGAAIATGTVLYVLGLRKSNGGQIGAVPMLAPGVAGISARGVF